MDLWQLRVFCKVVEEKSFSKAGKRIHLSQPTVSSHVKDLEAHFGCRLIDRFAKEALPTRAGELLYDYARKLLSLKAEAETAIAEFQGIIKGRLVVGGSTIPGVYILPALIGAFTRTHPDVFISLNIGDTENIVEKTVEGELDMAIVGARTGDRRILQAQFIEDELCLAVPADHTWVGRKTVPVTALFSEPFIVREPGSGTLKSIQQSFADAGYDIEDLKTAAEMGSTQAVIQAVKGGLGVSILSRIALTDPIKAGSLAALTVEGIDLKRGFYLTWRKHRTVSPLCQAFMTFVQDINRTSTEMEQKVAGTRDIRPYG